MKKAITDISFSKSVKDLVEGKSTLQNEIIGDLQKEFGSEAVPEKSEELPLREVAVYLNAGHSGELGKFTNSVISKLIANKMPAGFSMKNIKSYLTNEFGLGPKRIDGVLLHSLLIEPPNRLNSSKEAQEWLDQAVGAYAKYHGIQIPKLSSQHLGHGNIIATVSNEQLTALQVKQDIFVRNQLEVLAEYLDFDLRAGARLAEVHHNEIEKLQQELMRWKTEHGDVYADGIKPQFNGLKTRIYDSFENWNQQTLFMLYNDMLLGKPFDIDSDEMKFISQQTINRMTPKTFDFIRELLYRLQAASNSPGNGIKFFTNLIDQWTKTSNKSVPLYIEVSVPTAPKTTVCENGDIIYEEVPRLGVQSYEDYVNEIFTEYKGVTAVALKSRSNNDFSVWTVDMELNRIYFDILKEIASRGISFKNKRVLITGCGRGSIGEEILKALLMGGAKIIVTTSNFSKKTTQFYRDIYEKYGSLGSSLVVVSFNQASVEDVENLVQYIYTKINWDLDFVIPFAAISCNGTLSEIGSRSELAHRLMLVNLLRLLGAIVKQKRRLAIDTRPSHVILPLSPNRGVLGNDGLYGESKLALEALLNKWHSEDWKDYLTVIGAVIGWTRGTGLMSEHNRIAQFIEDQRVRTFSTREMAFNIIGLLHRRVLKMNEKTPICADLTGRWSLVSNVDSLFKKFYAHLAEESNTKKAVYVEKNIDSQLKEETLTRGVKPRSNMRFEYPKLKEYNELFHNPYLRKLIDLERVVVVTGFGETSPWGNARTRWEMEAFGEFSLEGCIEMAWMMGFIDYKDRVRLNDGKMYTGWVDAMTGEPVEEFEIKQKYEQKILEHSGIRLIEPKLWDGYDPNCKTLIQEVVLSQDMRPLEVSKEDAECFKRAHGDKVDVWETESGQWMARLKKGAILYVPKALRFDRLVAGQIPTGWNAKRFGIPDQIIQQVDPCTLYTLVSTVEALISSGITDPYEFYQYVHVSEIGNTTGSGFGGMRSMQKIFKDRLKSKTVQQDILQESFINTIPAWINMLLLGSAGPIKTPVGACATAVESVELAVETILSGKAKIVITGGCDDIKEESSYEFASMNATSNAVEELARGREPSEMSRPSTSTRSGFMESQGSGNQILMSADLALKMGVPIYGIIAFTHTAMDGEGRSVPAPGQGLLTSARQQLSASALESTTEQLLDISYRAAQLELELNSFKKYCESKSTLLNSDLPGQKSRRPEVDPDILQRIKSAQRHWGLDFYRHDPRIAPLRGALAVWGLTIDDIAVASYHGTGTKANDKNESEVLNKQMEHLGRRKGNLLPAIMQKYLTGHSKGGAAAWMLNGVLQVLTSSIIPGNRNADNIDDELVRFPYLLFLNRSIHTKGVKAAILKSFGFGQVGGEIVVLHPDLLFSVLEKSEYDEYKSRRSLREKKTYRYWHDVFIGARPFVEVKNSTPYDKNDAQLIYLDPLARASRQPNGEYRIRNMSSLDISAGHSIDSLDTLLNSVIRQMCSSSGLTTSLQNRCCGIGVDIELNAAINIDASTSAFIDRNFSKNEIDYCSRSPNPRASFCGRWAAKEAVVKAICNLKPELKQQWLKGAGAPLKDIEILSSVSGSPYVCLHGEVFKSLEDLSVKDIKVTISHSGDYSVACALVIAEH
jgi:fatty acid synthase subunit alpha